MTGGKRIALNSSILYLRLIVLTLLKLYLTRLLVRFLGLEDFGLYNLLAGTVAMLAFLKANMSATSQRFISVSLGKGNQKDTSEVFYTLFILHFIFALFVLILVDVVGIVLVENVLNINPNMIGVASIVVHTMAVTTAITIMCVPYDSVLISHENILALSVFLVLEAICNIVSILLVDIFKGNHLIFYTIVSSSFVFFIFITRIVYTRKYGETLFCFHKIHDFSVVKSIGSYMGWSTISSVFILFRNQGYAFLFNLVGGVIVNSAYGIANQVNAIVTYCVEAIMQPIRPQIMKKESSGEIENSIALTLFSTKCILMICSFVIIPLFVFIDEILQIWIVEVPLYCASFCRLLFINAYFFCFTNGIKALIESGGNVRGLFMIPGVVHLMIIITASLLAYNDVSIVICYSLIIVDQLICCCFRVHLLNKQYQVSPKVFYLKIFLPCVTSMFLCLAICTFIDMQVQSFTIALIIVLLSEVLIVPSFFYIFILSFKERILVQDLISLAHNKF